MINLRFKPQFASILLLSLFVLACTSSEESHIQDEAGSCLSDAMVERVSIDEVTQLQAHQSLVLPGQVVVNQDRVFRVYPAAGGIISDVHVRLGDRVHKGQRLATVQSPDIAEFQRDKRSAIAEKSLAERSLSLARSLYESGVNSERDLQEAKNNLERAESELERLHEMQRTLGVEEGQSTYIIRAPEAGFVVERNINPGLRLRAGDDHVFEISDLTDVWVVANVSENDIRNVRTQNEVSISMVAYPDHNFTGEIVRLSSALDPNRRTLEAIIELPNPDYLLKPGMFATVDVKVPVQDPNPAIHKQSLIFDNNNHYVVVYRDPCDVEVRQVLISSRSGDNVFIESGVREGEQVATNNHLLIFNELTLNGTR